MRVLIDGISDVLYRCGLVVSDQVLWDGAKGLCIKYMVTHPGFIGNLLGYKLGMVASCYAFIDDLVLLYSIFNGCVFELGHLDVISHDIERQVSSLRNCNKLLLIAIIFALIYLFLIEILLLDHSWAFKSSNWLQVLFKLRVVV